MVFIQFRRVLIIAGSQSKAAWLDPFMISSDDGGSGCEQVVAESRSQGEHIFD